VKPLRTSTWDVVVVGDFFMDIVMADFYRLPQLGEEAFARKLRHEIGGGAAITACGLARLGVNVAVLGVVGREDGMWIVKRLMAAGVNAMALEHHPTEPSGITVSVSTPEDRAFFTYYGANERLPFLLREPEARALMSSARHVHFACGPDPELDGDLFEELHREHCRVSLDVGWHVPWLEDPANLALLRQCDMFFPNEREGERLTGETDPSLMLGTLAERGVPAVGLKLGARGAKLLWKQRIYAVPPWPVAPIDTTGAGDSFDAGFIYEWLRGGSPEECLQTAAICGALSTRALGGIDGFPTAGELREALEEVGR